MTALYKVLGADGSSVHGGNGKWSLPGKGRPGKWMAEVKGELRLCENGYHLTRVPAAWFGTPDYRVFEAEVDGEVLEDGGDKVCVRKVRLIREVADLSTVAIYRPGQRHEHRGGKGVALAGSHVVARENSHVVAWENSHVEAWENSHVEAWGNSHVVAWENSHVVAWENSHVTTPTWAWGEPTVKLEGYALWIDSKSGKPVIHAVTAPEIVIQTEPVPA